MPIPRIAIVGRPNVGKSSLLNMIAGSKVSIVDSTAGTTRDRVTAVVDLPSPDGRKPERAVELTDTGGFGVYVEEGQRFNEVGADLGTLRDDIEFQIAEAVRSADVILLAVDAQAGLTPRDVEIARKLREGRLGREGPKSQRALAAKGKGKGKGKSSKAAEQQSSKEEQSDGAVSRRGAPVVRVVATKVDGPKWEAHALEVAALGFGEPLLCSAKSNYMRRDMIEALYGLLPKQEKGADEAPVDMRIAIVGKRNAGKSTLVNALAGEKRVIVSEIAGTTRDAVDVKFEMDGKSLLAIDTAGLRRKKSFANRIEWWAFDRAKRSIERADVVLLLIDATEPTSQVDEQLAMIIQKAAKPVVIVVNKWDLVEGKAGPSGKQIGVRDYEEYLRKDLKGLAFAPVSFISAETGKNIRQTVGLAFEMLEQARTRVGTGKLNRMVTGLIDKRNPSSKLGTLVKVFYVAQVAVCPPTIVLVVNRPELFSREYERFLINRFREELPFGEVPIRLWIRGRKQKVRGRKELIETAMTGDEIAEVEKEVLAEVAKGGTETDEAGGYFEEE